MGVFGAIDEDGNEFLNLHGRAGDVRLVASAPTLPDVPDVVVRASLPLGMPPPPPPSAESPDNEVDYEADDEVDYEGGTCVIAWCIIYVIILLCCTP